MLDKNGPNSVFHVQSSKTPDFCYVLNAASLLLILILMISHVLSYGLLVVMTVMLFFLKNELCRTYVFRLCVSRDLVFIPPGDNRRVDRRHRRRKRRKIAVTTTATSAQNTTAWAAVAAAPAAGAVEMAAGAVSATQRCLPFATNFYKMLSVTAVVYWAPMWPLIWCVFGVGIIIEMGIIFLSRVSRAS